MDLEYSGQFTPIPVVERIKASSNNYQLKLWILSAKQAGTEQHTLVYGMALPSRNPTLNFEANSYRHKINRNTRLRTFSFTISSSTCGQIAEDIAFGVNILEVLKTNSLKLPLVSLNHSLMRKMPGIMMPNRSMALSTLRRKSISESFSCYCLRYLPDITPDFLIENDPVIVEKINELLNDDIGFDLLNEAPESYGGLDFFYFPALDPDLRSKVRVTTRGDVMSLNISPFTDRSQFIVNIQEYQNHELIVDRLLQLNSKTSTGSHVVSPGRNRTIIRIWQAIDKESWDLWFEEDTTYIRTFSFNMVAMGVQATIKSNRLTQNASKNELGRVRKLETVQQESYVQNQNITSEQPWEQRVRSVQALASKRSSTTENSWFFPPQWHQFEKPIGIAEWLKNQLSLHSGKIVLIDPYFDELGIELISRVSGRAEELTVLLSSGMPSDDDSTEITRAQRLKHATTYLDPLLRGIKLRILDLNFANKNRSKAPFHDRYILFYSKSGNIKKGYNLSNSLQSAASKTPLLITGIDAKVLPAVSAYVDMLLSYGAPHYNQVEIYSARNRKNEPSAIDRNKQGLEILMKRLSEDSSASSSLIQELQNTSVLLNEPTKSILSEKAFRAIANHLHTRDIKAFEDYWIGLTLCHSPYSLEEFLNRFDELTDEHLKTKITENLAGWLKTIGTSQTASNHITPTLSVLSHNLDRSFLENAYSLYRTPEFYNARSYTVNQPIRKAIHVLHQYASADLEKAIRTLADVRKTLIRKTDTKDRNKDECIQNLRRLHLIENVLDTALSELFQFLDIRHHHTSISNKFAKSSVAVLRAIWTFGHFLPHIHFEDYKLKKRSIEALEKLNQYERQIALAFLTRYIRQQAPGHHLHFEKLPKWLQAAFVQDVDQITSEQWITLTRLYAGSYAISDPWPVYHWLHKKLSQKGILNRCEIFEIWNTILNKTELNSYSMERSVVMKVWSHALTQLETDKINVELKQIEDDFEKAANILHTPFIIDRNPKLWTQTTDGLFWKLAQVLHCYLVATQTCVQADLLQTLKNGFEILAREEEWFTYKISCPSVQDTIQLIQRHL